MTVDKPPLALWVQALSVRAFGFNSWAMLVPQALMGVASVGLVYDLVARRFGRAGGFIAGAVLALTPIAVAVSRHNNPDALLILCVVGALWAMVRGAGGRARALDGARGRVRRARLRDQDGRGAARRPGPGGRVGVGGAAQPRRAGCSAVGSRWLVAGGAWPLLVALTPASSRPWISGTSDNSIWSLIMDYNGLGRLDGQAGGPGGAAGGPGGGFGGGNGLFGGDPGVAAAAERRARRAGRLAARVRARRGRRARRLHAPVAARPGDGLGPGRRRLRADRGGRVLQRQGHLPPVLRERARAVHRRADRRRRVRFTQGDLLARIAGPLAIAAGVITELMVLGDDPDTLAWLPPVLVVARRARRGRAAFAPDARTRNAGDRDSAGDAPDRPGRLVRADAGPRHQRHLPAGGPATPGFGGRRPGRRRSRRLRRRPARRRQLRTRRHPAARAPAAPPPAAPPRRRRRPPAHRHPARAAPRPAAPRAAAASAAARAVGGGGLRRQLRLAHLRARLHQGQRRRHARGLQPVDRGGGDHRLRRGRRRHRRLLRPRERGHHGLARRRGRVGQDPLGPRRRRRRRRAAQRRPHRLDDRDGRRPVRLHVGRRRRRDPLRLRGPGRRDRRRR